MKTKIFQLIKFIIVVSFSHGVNAGEFDDDGRLDCLIEPHTVVNLSSEVPGVIDKILVQRGDHVKKGQLLFRLKATVEKSAVELSQAKNNFNKRRMVRNEELYKKQLLSIHEKDEMETEAKISALELRDARTRLNLRKVTSPIEGVVVVRHYSPGEYVTTDPVLEIAKINPLKVEVITPKRLIGKIKTGDKVEIYPDSPIDGQYDGKVTIVDEIIDAASGTFGVRVGLPNDDLKIPAGINCRIKF